MALTNLSFSEYCEDKQLKDENESLKNKLNYRDKLNQELTQEVKTLKSLVSDLRIEKSYINDRLKYRIKKSDEYKQEVKELNKVIKKLLEEE